MLRFLRERKQGVYFEENGDSYSNSLSSEISRALGIYFRRLSLQLHLTSLWVVLSVIPCAATIGSENSYFLPRHL